MSDDTADNKDNAEHKENDRKNEIIYPKYSSRVESLILRIALYTLSAIIVLTLFGVYIYFQTIDSLIKLLIYVACAGGIGGAVYSVQGLVKHYTSHDFKPDYQYWYFARPILAIFVGTFSIIIIAVGLMTFAGADMNSVFIINASVPSKVNNSTIIPIPDFQQPLIVSKALIFCAISFLGGYSTTSLLIRMNAVAKTIFGDTSNNDADIIEIKEGIKQLQADQKSNDKRMAELEKVAKSDKPLAPVIEIKKGDK
jgi:hypothetical protein